MPKVSVFKHYKGFYLKIITNRKSWFLNKKSVSAPRIAPQKSNLAVTTRFDMFFGSNGIRNVENTEFENCYQFFEVRWNNIF